MQQIKSLFIDSRHCLYDFRQEKQYKYNTLLTQSFVELAKLFQIEVIFCHRNHEINQYYFQEFKKHFPKINATLTTLEQFQQQKYQNICYLITHRYDQFKIQSNYQLYYYSSIIQKKEKKELLENQYYQNTSIPQLFRHISHIRQVLSDQSGSIIVGYYFFPKKLNELIGYGLLISNKNVTYVPIDFRFNNNLQHELINLCFHKLQDIYKVNEINFKEIDLFRQNYNSFSKHKKVLDKIDKLGVLIQRDQLNDTLQQLLNNEKYISLLKQSQLKIITPQQIVYLNEEGNQPQQQIEYPIIVKSKQGALVSNCHLMAIVVNQNGLNKLLQNNKFKGPLIFQQIINHDSTIYKIYQLGKKMIIQKRKSIPNIDIDNFKFEEGYFIFDSQKDLFSNVSQCLKVLDLNNHVDQELPIEQDLYKHFEILTNLIAQEFDIQLYGFDIIGKNNIYYIIDINHFPGFKNVDKTREQFEELFLQILS